MVCDVSLALAVLSSGLGILRRTRSFVLPAGLLPAWNWGGKCYSLRISVRTEFMRLMVFALTLAPSWEPPNEGSFCAALPQPTGGWFVRCVVLSKGACRDGWFGFWQDVLRARKRSSERTAMAFMRRTETGGAVG